MVAIINETQRDLLRGKTYDGVQFFNVDSADADGNYIIGQEEIDSTTNEDCLWVKDLELIEYKPPIIIDPII